MQLMRVAGELSKLIVSEDHQLMVEVFDFKAPKTRQQEKYFHVILGDAAEQVQVNGQRFSLETWKEYFARRYLGVIEEVMPDGEIIKRRRSTAEASIGEYAEMIDRTIDELAEEFGFVVEMAA